MLCKQAEVAKRFLKFVPEQHLRCGIITPLDSSFNKHFIDRFLQANKDIGCNSMGCRHPKTFELISGIINPVRALMHETEVASKILHFSTLFASDEHSSVRE